MSASSVLPLVKNPGRMTFAHGLDFIERTRRQLDRFDAAMPRTEGADIAPEDAAAIRQMCDELEADIAQHLSGI
jgi:hypothetical protein